ncbi:MAG: glycosyltransferase family 39 protein [Anaerolineae bacterium]|nr:glycosyltransferase family 39 protein [Anaerolineae bacterium]
MSRKITLPERCAIIAIFLLGFALRTVGLMQVPPGLHNDEIVELLFTKSVVEGRRGVFFPEDTGHETLYYYLAAAPMMYFFGQSHFALRFPLVILSTVTMIVVWAIARRMFDRIVAFTALTGFAMTFWPIMMARLILHTAMLPPMAALAGYCFWRAVSYPAQHKSTKWWALSGLFLGLSLNSYTASRILPVIWIAFGCYGYIVTRFKGTLPGELHPPVVWRQWGAGIAFVLVIAGVIVLPLALYLLQNPAADQLDYYDIGRPLEELRRGNVAPALETTLRTLGMFAFLGDPLPYYDVPGRPVFDPVSATLLGIGLCIALWHWREPRYAFVLIWFFLALVPGMLSQPAPNYTRTLCVQVVLFAIPGIALSAILNHPLFQPISRVNNLRRRILYGALGLLFLGNFSWNVYAYFVAWPSLDSVTFWHHASLRAVADNLQAKQIETIREGHPAQSETPPVVVCVLEHMIGESHPWWKPAWQHMNFLLDDTSLLANLRYYACEDASVLVPGPARYAFTNAGDLETLQRLPIYVDILAAADPQLEFLNHQLGIIVNIEQAMPLLEQYLQEIAIYSTLAWAPEVEGVTPAAQVPVTFQTVEPSDTRGIVQFIGYTLTAAEDRPSEDLSSGILIPGSTYDLTTYWRVIQTLPPKVFQFTHILDAHQNIVAQQDRLNITSQSLHPGDVFAQTHHLSLSADLSNGEYALSIGLYTQPDGVRFQILEGEYHHLDAQSCGDRLWLTPSVDETWFLIH